MLMLVFCGTIILIMEALDGASSEALGIALLVLIQFHFPELI